MNDANGMRRRESGQELPADRQDVAKRDTPAPQTRSEALPFDILHDDVGTGSLVDHVMNRGHVAVIDSSGGARLVKDARVFLTSFCDASRHFKATLRSRRVS